MTSPVDTTVKFFYNGMPGAPVLTPTVGSMVALLDACLVNGFGALTLTSLNVSNGIATAVFPGEFAARPEAVVLIAGATGAFAGLNGEQKVVSLGTGSFTFATAVQAGAATGTITAKMAPVGWDHAFTPGTNTRVYRTKDLTGSMRPYLRVTDTNAVSARMIGYETMTSLTAGTGLFPTAAQLSGGQYWNKGYTSGTTDVINWTLIGNGKRFQLWIAFGMSANFGGAPYTGEMGHLFGEFNSLKATADAYNGVIMGGITANGSSGGGLAVTFVTNSDPSISIARAHTNVAGARNAEYGIPFSSGGVPSGQNDVGGPLNGVMGKLMLHQPMLYLDRTSLGPRGYLKELFHIAQQVPVATVGMDKGDFVIGAGIAAGRKLLVVPGQVSPTPASNGAYKAVSLVDVTGPWE